MSCTHAPLALPFAKPLNLATLAILLGLSPTVHAASVWDRSIVHPLPTGRLPTLADCRFGSTACAVQGSRHLGVDLMAAANTNVVALCDGTVRHNNTQTATIWNSKVIIEHACGGHFQAQPVFGHYGHISSTLGVGANVRAGEVVGRIKNDGNNSHLHFGVGYSSHESQWGYGSGLADFFDFNSIVYRPATRPNLVAPQHNSAQGAAVSLVWNSVAGASNYRVVLSRDANPLLSFDNNSRSCVAARGGSNSCWTNTSVSANLSRDLAPGTYYWTVRADNSDWSEISSFIVGNGGGNASAGAASWSTGVYRNNEQTERTLSLPGASALTVSVQGRLEQGYDFIRIFDAAGMLRGSYTGSIQTTLIVPGSSIKARLETDGSVVDAGVTVSISAAPAAPPAPALDPASALIEACHAKYQQYFGAKQGGREDCFGGAFVCQRTAGPATLLAVEKPGTQNILYYWWGGWGSVQAGQCR